eukprot:GFYU01008537.1.p1 GENE.GFYU01008537.1~~GFYU01008537.1.p1  ORF type:complete len:107 (+),score=30.54 GFYU01008537.1:43-321(+)
MDFVLCYDGSCEVFAGNSVYKLDTSHLRATNQITILQLKKYLVMKLNLRSIEDAVVTCNGEVTGNEHTLEYIVRRVWRTRKPPLILKYNITT